ncbi:MAG: tRNA epoxyqueuosine(34) reductase QueG [Acidobacteria bacterium]|nr:tRNA epoxyqueuosine(34) reductase QueG [Acidobacteriota bacterium]
MNAAKNRAELLIGWALASGFDRAGVASVEPRAGAGSVFLRRLERGLFASMAWLGRRTRRRLVPASVLDGARSVLCVALHYHPLEGEPEPQGDLWPRVARYARGDDYHLLMERRLRALAARIREAFPGSGARIYVDTGPVLERDLAARAGLGAVAKNTQLLDRTGSWFLLGELFLTLELEPSEPLAEDLCGDCRRCLDACPTGALPAPYVLDSRKCISYWTIEHRGEVPEQTRPLVGDWVFGCDICQEVCPWNEHRATPATPDRSGEFSLPAHRAELDLEALLGLSEGEYRTRFRRSPMKRPGRSGLRRNAALAMGNRGEAVYIPALERARGSRDPVVRNHAAWALERLEARVAEQPGRGA